MTTGCPGASGATCADRLSASNMCRNSTFFDTFAGVNLTDSAAVVAARRAARQRGDARTGPRWRYFNAPWRARRALLDRVLYADMKTYLVELLMKQDQMSMAASIESRVPFLDHHLVEFAAGLPANRKLSGWSTKRILREAVRDMLPPSILDRPKMGFPVPFARWLAGWLGRRRKGGLARFVGAVSAASSSQRRSSGCSPPGSVDQQDADAVWALLNLELWYRTFIDGEGIQTLPAPAAPVRAKRCRAAAAERCRLAEPCAFSG